MKSIVIVIIVVVLTSASALASMDSECGLFGDYVGVVGLYWNGTTFNKEMRNLSGCEDVFIGNNWHTFYIADYLPRCHHSFALVGFGNNTRFSSEARDPFTYKVEGESIFEWDYLSVSTTNVTLCIKSSDASSLSIVGGAHGVPEFSTYTMGLAVLVGVLGLSFLRKA